MYFRKCLESCGLPTLLRPRFWSMYGLHGVQCLLYTIGGESLRGVHNRAHLFLFAISCACSSALLSTIVSKVLCLNRASMSAAAVSALLSVQ